MLIIDLYAILTLDPGRRNEHRKPVDFAFEYAKPGKNEVFLFSVAYGTGFIGIEQMHERTSPAQAKKGKQGKTTLPRSADADLLTARIVYHFR